MSCWRWSDSFVCAGRYVAPEVFKNEEYDTKVDVFSFALILQEVNHPSPLSLSTIAVYVCCYFHLNFI